MGEYARTHGAEYIAVILFHAGWCGNYFNSSDTQLLVYTAYCNNALANLVTSNYQEIYGDMEIYGGIEGQGNMYIIEKWQHYFFVTKYNWALSKSSGMLYSITIPFFHSSIATTVTNKSCSTHAAQPAPALPLLAVHDTEASLNQHTR